MLSRSPQLKARAIRCALLLAMFTAICWSRADNTFVYSVQLSATVQASPARIVLSWPADPYGANSYTLYRKTRDATSWGSGVSLAGSSTSYTDSNVSNGTAYEYQIVKNASLGYLGTGYIYAGINVPPAENRGKLILVVANNISAGLSNELARLETDLIGDGWQVLRHDVSTSATPAYVRGLITADYGADAANVKAVFLFGRVPVLRSGNLDYDGHGARAMPADAYYGDIDGDWSGNPSFIPSDVELMVGRVDLATMPGLNAPTPWPGELELLRNYLNKDHRWRHKLFTVPRRALMGNRAGDFGGEAFAASGYRAFETFVGPGNTIEANVQDNAAAAERWISVLATGRYLWAYGCGGGDYTSISQLGTHGIYNDVWSIDVVSQDAGAVFLMLYGSHFGEWDASDDFMRSFLATSSVGLAACLSGRPHLFMHHIGLGEPLGFSMRVSMNNRTLYVTQTNAFTRGVHLGLMGDPSLRMDTVAPAGSLQATAGAGGVNLTWTASADATAGYYIYRSSNPKGPFTRLTGSPVTSTSFTDTTGSGTLNYMVRALKLQVTPSGSYSNLSQGVFASITTGMATGPISVTIRRSSGNVVLSWRAQSGVIYRVLGKDTATQSTWSDLSGTITTNGATASWISSDPTKRPERLYKVASP